MTVSERRAAALCALTVLLLLSGCVGPRVGTLATLALATPVTVIAVFVSSAFAGRRTLLEATVYLLVCALIVAVTIFDFLSHLNTAARVLVRSLAVAIVIGSSVALFTLPNSKSILIALSWTVFTFVFAFVLLAGDELIAGERSDLERSICHASESLRINVQITNGLMDELKRFRDIDQWSYVSLLVAPLITITLVLRHRLAEAMALPAMITIAALLMVCSIVVLTFRVGARLGSPLFWPLDVSLSWEQYKNVFALSCDAKAIMLYEGIHNLSVAIGYIIAVGAIAAGRTQVLPAVAVTMLTIVIFAGLALCVPMFIGYRASLAEFRSRVEVASATTYVELSGYETELHQLRQPFAPLRSWKFILPVLTAAGAVTAVSLKALGFFPK